MMAQMENRHTMASPAGNGELRRTRARQAGGGVVRRMRALAGVALVCALALGAEGDVASDNNTLATSPSASARAQEVAREDAGAGFLYSRWIEGREVYDPAGVIEVDEVELGSLPPPPPIGRGEYGALPQPLPGGKGEAPGSFWGDVAGKVREGTTQRLRGSLLGVLPKPEELRAILIKYGNGEEFDMAQWREIRRQQLKAAIENAPLAFYADTETAIASALSQTAVDRLGFVRRARVDFRTSLGDRQASGGVDAAGALRESEDEVIGWQLRAYAGEGGKRGGNIGAFWRRAQWLHFVDEGLLGANIFADYEDTDDGSFWRWSLGGEMKTRVGDVNVNRYFVLTDPVVLANNRRVYSRAGVDIDAALNIPGAEWAKARVGYFLWEGEFGDADIEGFKAGFDFKPGAGVVVGVEFDGESGDIGGNFAYTHNIGEPFASAQSAGAFDPRAHFFDAVRREYSQRIVNTGAGDGANFAVIVTTGLDFTIRGELPGTSTAAVNTLNIAAASLTTGVNDEFAITGNVTVETNTTPANGMAVFRQRGGNWHLTLNANSEVAFTNTAHLLVINRGSGEFERVNPPRPAGVVVAGTTLSLIGTRFRFGVPSVVSQTDKASITLVEGGMMADMAAMDRVTIKVGERASVMVMMGGSMVVVGCGEGQVANAGGAGARCSSGGSVDLTPVDAPPNVSVEGGRVLVPFGALATVGHFDVAMLAAETTLTANVETAGFGVIAVTSADGMTVTYDVVLQESQATIAGTKNPRVIVSDIAEFVRPITVVFTVQVARKLQVGVNPASVAVTQNITAAGIARVNGNAGTPPYSYTLLSPQNLFNLGGDDNNIVNNNNRIQSTGVQSVVLEATDALQDKATVTLLVNVPPTPPLVLGELGLFVAVTNTGYSFAGQLLASGGVPPLQYRIRAGTSGNYGETANIPNVGAVTVNTTSGEVRVQSASVSATFPLYYEVRDPVGTVSAGVVTVSVSEGVALSGPMLGITLTATTNGGANTEQSLGTVMAQLRPGVGVSQMNVIEGNSHVRLRAGSDGTRREVYYIGNTREVTTALIRIRVTDNSPQSDRPIPNMATASFHLAIVDPADITAGLSGGVGLRYFADGQTYTILTATASGGAGGYRFLITTSGGSGAQMRNVANAEGVNEGVLSYSGSSTTPITVTVYGEDNHSNTAPDPAVTVTLSALARLRAESIPRPQITTGATLQGDDVNVVTVSISGGENRAAFAYSRIEAGNQLANARINNQGVINAANNTRIDAEEINNSKAGNRNFVYQVIDGAIPVRRQTLLVTLVFNSRVPSEINAAHVGFVNNNVVTVGNAATVKWRIRTSGGHTVTNYDFSQHAAGAIVAASFEQNAGNTEVTALLRAASAGTVTVSVVVGDQHEDTEAATVSRQFIGIDPLMIDFVGEDFTPQTTSLHITVGTVRAVGGLNARVQDTFVNRGGDTGSDLRLVNLTPPVATLRALVLRNDGNPGRNEGERTVTFEIAATGNNNDRAVITGSVEVVAELRLNGGGEYIVTTGSQGLTIATIRAVGGERGDGYQFTDPSISAPFAALEIDNDNDLRVVKLGNTAIPANRSGQSDSLIFSVTDDATPQANYATTLTARYVNPLGAANTYKDGGGVVTMAAGLQVIGTITGSGGVGNFTFAEIGASPLNVNAEGEINGTFNSPLTATMQVRVDDAGSGGEAVAATHPVTVEVAVTVFAPVTANVNQTVRRHRKGVSVTLAALTYSGGSGTAGLTASVLSFYQANSRAVVTANEVVVWPDPNVTQRGTARIMIVTYDTANAAAPQSTITFPLYVVDALRWTSPPSEPLTVTTQGVQSGSAFNNPDALPRLLGVVGGNADNSYNLGSRTPGFALGSQNQQFSYTGNGGRFAQDADTVLVTVYGIDRNAADNYRQTTSLTITVAFIDPPDLTIGFDGAFNSTPLTSSESAGITIGTVVLGAGLNPQDPSILGNGGDFRVGNPAALGDGTVQLLLGGTNTGERVTMVTLTGDDERHTGTDAVMMTVAVTVVDRIKLNGGGRYTVFADVAKTEPVAVLTAVGGRGERTYGLQTTPALPGYVSSAGGGAEPITLTYVDTHADATVGALATIAATVKDTDNTVSATVEVTIIGALAAAIDFAGGALTTGVTATVATISASGGVGDYTFTEDNANVNVVDGTIFVARFTTPTTTTIDLIADDDNAAITEPVTLNIALTALAPLTLTPVPNLTLTTAANPGSSPLFTLAAAQGGQPPYEYGRYNNMNFVPVNSAANVIVSPRGVVEIRSQTVIYGAGRNARSNTGLEAQLHPFAVRDSSTPPRVFGLPNFTIEYVAPPSVAIADVDQTVNRYKNEASVAVAALTYSGGSGGAGLTATVAGVEAGVTALVTNNTVVVSASAGVTGNKEITIAAYDSANNTAPSAMTVLSVHFVAPLGFANLPGAPLLVTTQDSQPSEVAAGVALPVSVPASGGNGTYAYTRNAIGFPSPGAQFSGGFVYENGILRFNPNTGDEFHQNPVTVAAQIIAGDTAQDGYSQTATTRITVHFVDPPDVTIGFESGADFAPLTSAAAITIGALVVGGGLNAKDADFVGNANGFSIDNADTDDTGTVNLVLGVGNGTNPRTVTVTVSGDDGHSNTEPATITVTVEVVDRVKLEGAGRRYTVLAQAGNDIAELFALKPVGGTPPYGNQSVVSPTNPPTGFTRSADDKTVTIGRNAVSIAAGEEHVFVQEISDAGGTTLRFSATVTVINELALSVGDNAGGNAFNGAIDLPAGYAFGRGFASGGAGAYTYRVEGPGSNINVQQSNGEMIANHSSTHDDATITYTLIADDATDITAPATAVFTLTVLRRVEAEPLPVITVTTKSTPGGAGGGGEAQTVTTRVEFTYETSGLFAVDLDLRTSVSIVITVAPGADVTVTRNIGAELAALQNNNRRAEVIATRTPAAGRNVGDNFQIPLGALNLTLAPYPALSGGGGGGSVPAFTISASGGHGPLSYRLNNATTPGALADNILYYAADSENSGIVYFNAGVQARAEAGNNVIAPNLQVRDSSAPARSANVPGMITIRYVSPPDVTVAANQTVSAYKTGASITVAELTYSGGASDDLTATVLGFAGDAANIMARVSGGDLILSAAAAASPETITVSINAFDAGNDTAENDTAVITFQFVAPLVFSFGAVPTEPLTLTTQDTQGNTPGGDILPLRVPAGGGNGSNTGDYNYVVTTPGFTFNNGLLRYTDNGGDKFAVSATLITVEIVARDQNETRHYGQAVTASITLEFTNPPALSMGFVESPLAAALTTDAAITIGTIALTGGLADLSIVIAGHDDFSLSLIEASSATAALILSGSNNANADARTVSVTITGNDNHTETDARMLSLTVRINKELTLLAPATITITAGHIDGFTGADGTMATLANLTVQGFTVAAAADVKVTLLADGTNLSASVLAQLSIEGEGEQRALVINSSLVAYGNITMNGGDYDMVFEITDGSGSGASVASITIAAKVANAPVYAARTATISTYYYTGAAGAFVPLATISLTNVWNTIGAQSVSIGVSEITGENAGKYNGALTANYINDPGELEIRYTRPAAPAAADGFTVDVMVTVISSDEDNPFTMTATVHWSHVVLPVLSLDFQSPANTVFIRGYKGTIGVLTVNVASAPQSNSTGMGLTDTGSTAPGESPSPHIINLNLASLPPPPNFDPKNASSHLSRGETHHPLTHLSTGVSNLT